MLIMSFRQFYEFLKFSFSMPFRMGWSIVGILLFGTLLLSFLYFFEFLITTYQYVDYENPLLNFYNPALPYTALNFFALLVQEFLWQLWTILIFIAVIVVDMGQKPVLDIVKGMIIKHYQSILLLAAVISCLFVLLPSAALDFQYNYKSRSYFFHYFMIYIIGIFFVFALIEIVRKDRDFFDAFAASIYLLKGRYIFTYITLSVVIFCLNKSHIVVHNVYMWIYADSYNNLSHLSVQEALTYYKRMSVVLGGIVAVVKFLITTIYSGAVIYLYKIYSQQDIKK